MKIQSRGDVVWARLKSSKARWPARPSWRWLVFWLAVLLFSLFFASLTPVSGQSLPSGELPILPLALGSMDSTQAMQLLSQRLNEQILLSQQLTQLALAQKQRIDTLESSLPQLKAQLSSSQADQASVSKELAISQQDLADSQTALKTTQDSLSSSRKEIDSLKAQIAAYAKSGENVVNDLQKQLAAERLKAQAFKVGLITVGGFVVIDVGSELIAGKSIFELAKSLF